MSGGTYQRLQQYQGSLYDSPPQYTGIEYDYEVPDNIVVSSPGGVSNTQHGWEKGFYGTPVSTYDIYAGEGNRYPYGEFGNLYQVGQNAPTEMGMYPPGADQMYTGNQSTAHVENFVGGYIPAQGYGPSGQHPGYDRRPPRLRGNQGTTPVPGMSDIVPIAPPDTSSSVSVSNAVKSELVNITHQIHLPSPWLILLMFAFLYIALDLFTTAGENALFAKFHGGKTPDWRWLVFYGAIFTALAIALGMSVKDPLLALKRFEGED